MTGVSEDKRQVKPDPLNPKLINGGFEDDANKDGRADNWHYQRQTKLLGIKPPEGRQFLEFENTEPGRLSQVLQGMAIDGRRIRALRVSLDVKYEKIHNNGRNQQASLMVHFYDSIRKPIGESVIGPWTGSQQDWEKVVATIRIPPQTQEIIVRIGLNGATGTLDVDNVELARRNR